MKKESSERNIASTLSENIRTYRKARKLTQEQLAEVLNVTTGAVYKWESGLSLPELNLIVEMAEFFDVSVDVLLGYKVNDNSVKHYIEKMVVFCRTGDTEALNEAEKALKRYPNSFELVLACADVYLYYATLSASKKEAKRALELQEQALVLLPQNKDPNISEHTIYTKMATAYMLRGEYEKCVELMKKHNVEGINDGVIGVVLSVFLNRPDEAESYLSSAILQGMSFILNSVSGFAFVFKSRGEFKKAHEITEVAIQLLDNLKKSRITAAGSPGKPDFSDKIYATFLALRAYTQYHTNQKRKASESIMAAYHLAKQFDALPSYTLDDLKFVKLSEFSAYQDILGRTAIESIDNGVKLLGDKDVIALWEAIRRE